MESFPQKYCDVSLIPDFPKAPSRNFWRQILNQNSQSNDLTAEVLHKSMKARTQASVLRTVKTFMNLQL